MTEIEFLCFLSMGQLIAAPILNTIQLQNFPKISHFTYLQYS